jgi:hypothetical protein
MTPTQWVTGQCWLYCQRPDALVTWIGPVHHNGAHAPMYACHPCLRTLAGLVHAHTATGDRTPVTLR